MSIAGAAARQVRYRRRAIGSGRLVRIDMVVPADVNADLEAAAKHYGISKCDALGLAVGKLLARANAEAARRARAERQSAAKARSLAEQTDIEQWIDQQPGELGKPAGEVAQ